MALRYKGFRTAAIAATGAFLTFDRTSHCKTVDRHVVQDTKKHVGFLWGRGKGIQDLPVWCGEKSITFLSFGRAHSAAVCDKGNIWFWGCKEDGKPSLVQSNTSFHSVAVGTSRSYGLTRDGKVLFWSNEDPTKLQPLNANQNSWFGSDKVLQISAFDENVAFVTSSGKAMAMGRGGLGQLGNGKVHDNTTSFELMVLPAGEKASSVAVGQNHTAILTTSGKILMCGSDAAMQLGRRDTVSSWTRKEEDKTQVFHAIPAPLDLPPDLLGKPFLSISAGQNFTAAIVKLEDERGRQGVVTFGEGLDGQLGHKTPQHVGRVRLVDALTGRKEWDERSGETRSLYPVQVACGASHVVALMSNGATLAWGANREMQLGDGGRAGCRTPGLVMALQQHRVRAAFAGADASGVVV